MNRAITNAYASGAYFGTHSRHAEDAAFKADGFLKLFRRVTQTHELEVSSYADVGCGSGAGSEIVAQGLREAGIKLVAAWAYDVSPHVTQLRSETVDFVHGDFCKSNAQADLVTLFDVFEHVVAPIEFLQAISRRCHIVGLHIPLDDCLNHTVRDRFRSLLRDPGHLTFLNPVSALNLLTLAGLRVLDYEYSFAYRAPSGSRTLKAKALYPVRSVLGAVSPWLLSRIVGGASLMVVAATPRLLAQERQADSRDRST